MNGINVVGGSGFIGTRLCRRLVGEAYPAFKILDLKPSRHFLTRSAVCDIRDVQQLKKTLVPRAPLIHLAAEHRDDVRPKTLYQEVNVEGTKNVCIAARELEINTILFTSTVAVYGLAQANTGEDGRIAPFNEYGRTKWEAEKVLQAWAAERPAERRLVIVRPTVVFGENNRGNVYNLLRQVARRRFVMIGSGVNRKSMAYVENVAAFLEHCIDGPAGVQVINYVDKPDLTMNDLVSTVSELLGYSAGLRIRLPYAFGIAIGAVADCVARRTGRSFAISKVRVMKFCSETTFASSAAGTGFVAPVSLMEGISRTVRHEFLESHSGEEIFITE